MERCHTVRSLNDWPTPSPSQSLVPTSLAPLIYAPVSSDTNASYAAASSSASHCDGSEEEENKDVAES